MDFYPLLHPTVDLFHTPTAHFSPSPLPFTPPRSLEGGELLYAHPEVVDDAGRGLLWTGAPEAAPPPAAAPALAQDQAPLTYTPPHLAEKILTSRAALEGERKQVTVLFADLKGSMELLAERDPEEARHLLDPVLDRMMAAVHQYEGTVNQVMGDGIMALFGAPLAHEDHAVRACYAALRMQEAVKQYAAEVQRSHGVPIHIRVGLNAGEVVVRSIGSDLHMDYTAVGQTTHLAARMEQMAMPGSILITPAVLGLVEGFVQVKALGAMPVRGLRDPVEVYEVTGAGVVRSRLQAAAARGLTRFVGRQPELETLQQALAQAQAGHGQVVALVGEAGVGKSRLLYEFGHSHHTQGWLVLESASVSYGKATPYFPVIDLLKRYCHVEERDDPRTIRAKVTGQILTLDEALQETIPALLALLDALPADSPFLTLDPPQRRQRTLDGLKRLLLRESQVQPLLLVFEDLHWIDTETQALLDSLVESLPTARLLLLVNYRPEYQHGWGSKTYYRQLRLDPLAARECGRIPPGAAGGRPQPGAPQATPDRTHRGQSVLSGGERAHPGGDGDARRRAGCLSAGAAPRQPADAGHGAGGAGGAHRPAAAGGETRAPDRGGHRHRGALAPVAGHCRAARGGPAPRPGAPASGRVPLRDAAVPRARIHLQARPDARGGLQRSAPGAAAGAARADCRGPRSALPGPPGRAGGTAGAPCHAGRGVGQGPGLQPAGRGPGGSRSAYREAVAYFEQALVAWSISPSAATR